MTFVLFLLYAAIGGGVGYGVFTLTDVGMPLSIAAGGIATALLGQIHILIKSDRSTKEIDERIDRGELRMRDLYGLVATFVQSLKYVIPPETRKLSGGKTSTKFYS